MHCTTAVAVRRGGLLGEACMRSAIEDNKQRNGRICGRHARYDDDGGSAPWWG